MNTMLSHDISIQDSHKESFSSSWNLNEEVQNVLDIISDKLSYELIKKIPFEMEEWNDLNTIHIKDKRLIEELFNPEDSIDASRLLTLYQDIKILQKEYMKFQRELRILTHHKGFGVNNIMRIKLWLENIESYKQYLSSLPHKIFDLKNTILDIYNKLLSLEYEFDAIADKGYTLDPKKKHKYYIGKDRDILFP